MKERRGKRGNKIDIFSLLSVGFLIAVTANPFFYETIHPILFGALYFGLLFFKRGNKVHKKFHYLILFVTIVFAGQYITTGVLSIMTFLGVLLRFYLAYFVLRLIRYDFFLTTARFVYITAVISLVIYIPLTIYTPLVDILKSNISPLVQAPFTDEFRPHIIIYDLSSMDLRRYGNFGLNSGFYWEPGAHAIFLIYALCINLFFKNRIASKENFIIIITIFTTFSTTGYVSLIILLFFYFLTVKSKRIRIRAYLFILPILVVITYFSFSRLSFLKDKIRDDITYIYSNKNEGSRFQSFLLDFSLWQQYPLFGKDRSVDEAGNALELTYELHRNNGLGILLATYGIFAFLLYLWMIVKGLRRLSGYHHLNVRFVQAFLLLFLLTTFAMPMTLRPYYYALVLIPIVYIKNEKTKLALIRDEAN